MSERLSDYVISRLVEANVKHLFMITGRGILYLTDAVAKNPDIQHISTFHEQGASYAAMAYATNRNLGACLISTGCASTNAVTAALCAWQDGIPCIFISGQNPLEETVRFTKSSRRTYGSQEADIIRIVESITKYSEMVTDPSKIGYIMDRAIYEATHGRMGPVWIDIPLDIQNQKIDPDSLERFEPEANSQIPDAVCDVFKDFLTHERPIMLIGGGVRASCDETFFEKFVKKYNIPVVFTTSAVDFYGSGNPLAIGAVGSLAGSRAGNFAIQNADCVLAVGTKLSSQTIGPNPSDFARSAKIYVVDIDEAEHRDSPLKKDKLIICDAMEFFEKCDSMPLGTVVDHSAWVDKCLHWKSIFDVSMEGFYKESEEKGIIDLYLFADRLSQAISDSTTVITDAGLEELIIPSTIKYRRGQKCLFPSNQGAMGYAIPAVLGAYYSGSKEIVAVVGDGSAMMNIQELQTISFHKIPVKIFIINNNMYSIIRKRQHDLFRERTIGNDPSDGVPEPDYRKIADCFGLTYHKIETVSQLDKDLPAILDVDGALICEVLCPPEQKYLHTSFAFDEKRKLVKRSLEDLSPFLDRDLIKKELIIDYKG